MWATKRSPPRWPSAVSPSDAEQQAAGEAQLAPQRHRPALPGERRRPARVQHAGEHRRDELQRLDGRGEMTEGRHEAQASPSAAADDRRDPEERDRDAGALHARAGARFSTTAREQHGQHRVQRADDRDDRQQRPSCWPSA